MHRIRVHPHHSRISAHSFTPSCWTPRDCLNGNLETASTNFQQEGVDKLIIKNSQIESTVDFKVAKIIFPDNTNLTTAPTGGGGFDLSVRNDYPYIYTNTQVINQNYVDSGTWQFFELNSDASNPVYMTYLRNYPSNNVYNKPKNIIHFYTDYDDSGYFFGGIDSGNQWKQWLHINDFELFTDRNIKLSKRSTDTEDPKIIFHDGTSISSFPTLSTVATSGNYNDLTNRPTLAPVATTNSYYSLSNRPSLAPVATTGYYSSLYNIPNFGTVAYSNNYNSLYNLPNLQPVATSGSYNSLSDKPTLSTIAISGSYNDLTNTPTLPPTPAIWKYKLNTINNVNHSYSGSSNNFPAIFSGVGSVLLNLNN